MSKDKKLVPDLRFPEFKQSEWMYKKLGDITYSINKRNKGGDKYPIYSINNKEGFIPQSEQFEGVNSHTRGYDVSLYKVINRNTFAYNPARINVGSIGYSNNLEDIIVSSLYVCFKTKDDVDDNFLIHKLKSDQFIASVQKNVEGGIRSYLFYENFAQISIAIPVRAEQQKIADCLSSLDDLMEAQIQKLDILKGHKKGLMQQLFPAKGETIPKLRFKEFETAGEWTKKLLKDITKGISSGRDVAAESGSYNLYGSTGIIGKAMYGSYNGRYILAARVGANAGLLTKVGGEFAVTDNTLVISLSDLQQLDFVYYSLSQIGLNKYIFGSGQPLVTGTQLKNIEICLPLYKEQQKIAYCLSSLDNLIDATVQKIDTLRLHRKGLMQQLFPAII